MSDICESKEEYNAQTHQDELTEIEQIESIEYFISTLSPEEIQNKINLYQQITQSQLTHLAQLFNDVDSKVTKATQVSKQPFVKSGVLSSCSSVSKLDEINHKHKEHIKRIKKLERETGDRLKQALQALEDDYNKEMNTMVESHNEKVKLLSVTSEKNQSILNDLNDSNKFITVQSHNKELSQISSKYRNEIEKLDEEIQQLESVIKANYSQWINRQTNSIVMPNDQKVYNRGLASKIKEFVTKMKNQNGNDDIISLISQMQVDESNDMEDDNIVENNKDKDNDEEHDNDNESNEENEWVNTITINLDGDCDVQEFNKNEKEICARQIPFHIYKIKKNN